MSQQPDKQYEELCRAFESVIRRVQEYLDDDATLDEVDQRIVRRQIEDVRNGIRDLDPRLVRRRPGQVWALVSKLTEVVSCLLVGRSS